ncbi:MAG TPA: pyrroline-5-carboxylate reductase [Clostridiales bacterium]|nr:pyrroline-5-carboxylate reductase [Clostridiales bacterium]
MSTYQLGFIGTGNMGGALAQAAAKSGAGMLLSNRTADKAVRLAAELGCAAGTNLEVAEGCKYIFLGVKPQMIDGVVQSLAAPIAASESIFVSMLAGVQLERLERLLGADKKIIRILPNTACAVGQGVVLYCANGNVTDGDLAAFCALMAAAGIVDPISEALIDAGCAITGCGPAFAYMFIEALADGGVKCGLPRAKAIRYAAQMLAGSAEMVLQSGKHPEQLKDEVCSPGGSTIAGVDALEQHGFRGSCIAAVDAAFEKTRQLG